MEFNVTPSGFTSKDIRYLDPNDPEDIRNLYRYFVWWCLGHNLDVVAGLYAMRTLGTEEAHQAGYKEGLAAGKLAEAMNERRIILPGRRN